MAKPIRISAKEAKEEATSGVAQLVCGYIDEDKFSGNHP
jgi:hypothetical protein